MYYIFNYNKKKNFKTKCYFFLLIIYRKFLLFLYNNYYNYFDRI